MGATREQFFEKVHSEYQYLGYDDIGLRNELISEVDWHEVDITGHVSKNWALRIPIIGAAMNSISEDAMGIAMAKAGAAVFLHHANTPEEQKVMAENVYHHLSGIIREPLVAYEGQTVEEVQQGLINRGKGFRTIPVVRRENGACIGLMDDDTFKLLDPTMPITDAMRPRGSFATGASDLSPTEIFEQMKARKDGKFVLLGEGDRLEGLCILNDIRRIVNSNPDAYSLDEEGHLVAFASVPTIPDEAIERVGLLKKYVKVIGIDTSHGEHRYALDTLRAIREKYPDIDVLAGNISTYETAVEIAKLEPAGIVVGQGPGSICKSSDVLGVGTPQASAVYEVSKGAREIVPDMPIIADGGINEPSATVVAFACGATAVKVGGLISGTDEAPGEIELDEKNSQPFKWYYGMGSERAQKAFAAARARYGDYRVHAPGAKLLLEGFEKRVYLKGPVKDILEGHVMGVQRSMSSQGFGTIKELQDGARFMRGSNRKS